MSKLQKTRLSILVITIFLPIIFPAYVLLAGWQEMWPELRDYPKNVRYMWKHGRL